MEQTTNKPNNIKTNILKGIVLINDFELFFYCLMTVLIFLINQYFFAIDKDEFIYQTEQFADLKMIRYRVPGFEELDLRQKKLIYYLSQASLSGRDIIFDQNYRNNLKIRRTLETIVANYDGNRNSKEFKEFMIYVKRFGFLEEFTNTTLVQNYNLVFRLNFLTT